MTYLLDTCIVSKLRKLSKHPDPGLQRWIGEHPAGLYSISVFSIAELQSGISKLDISNAAGKKFRLELEDWLLNDLIPDFGERIIEFDLELALCWGSLIGENKKKGINLPIIDSLIAATALHHRLIVVTENVIDFEKSGVLTINPCAKI